MDTLFHYNTYEIRNSKQEMMRWREHQLFIKVLMLYGAGGEGVFEKCGMQQKFFNNFIFYCDFLLLLLLPQN